MSTKPKPLVTKVEMNFWAMIESLVKFSIPKGMFLPVALVGLVALIILKIPDEQMPVLMGKVSATLLRWSTLSYFANVGLIVLIVVMTRLQRAALASEMDRIGREKSLLQEATIGTRLSHSGPQGPSQ